MVVKCHSAVGEGTENSVWEQFGNGEGARRMGAICWKCVKELGSTEVLELQDRRLAK